MKSKYSRICWNTQGWRRPTGEAKLIETKGSYVADHGFGHEEWLFHFEWLLPIPDGDSEIKYRYGHLQTIRRNYEAYVGETFRIMLYVFDPGMRRLLVASIENCYVPRPNELSLVHKHFKEKGWLAEMRVDLQKIGADSSPLDSEQPIDIIDIRFRESDVTFVEPWLEIPEGLKPYSLDRYRLLNAQDGDLLTLELNHGESSVPQPMIDPRRNETLRNRPAIDPTSYEPTHVKLQNQIFSYLVEKFGQMAVSYEDANVDLTLHLPKQTKLIEIKTDNTARQCIRAALGQILEYAFYKKDWIDPGVSLVMVGEAAPTVSDLEYLKYIKGRFSLPIAYCQWSWEKMKLLPGLEELVT